MTVRKQFILALVAMQVAASILMAIVAGRFLSATLEQIIAASNNPILAVMHDRVMMRTVVSFAAIAFLVTAVTIPAGLLLSRLMVAPYLRVIKRFSTLARRRLNIDEFGGLGKNPFNPALAGRVFMLISFPVDMTSWPLPVQNRMVIVDALTGPTALGTLSEGIKNGETVSQLASKLPDYTHLMMGNIGGSLGEVSAIALLIGGIYMIWRKIISWHIPVSYLLTVFLFTGLLWLINPERYIDPVFHLLAGGLILGAVFMATDMVTSPMTTKGMLIFGLGCGLLTVLIRVWGSYPEGVSFAILIMNAVTPLLNKYIKPVRFGEKVKA